MRNYKQENKITAGRRRITERLETTKEHKECKRWALMSIKERDNMEKSMPRHTLHVPQYAP